LGFLITALFNARILLLESWGFVLGEQLRRNHRLSGAGIVWSICYAENNIRVFEKGNQKA